MDSPTPKLIALPFQLIETDQGLLLKRGCSVLKIQGAGAGLAIRTVLSALHKQPSTQEELTHLFPPAEQTAISQLLDTLISKRFVIAHTSQLDDSSRIEPENPLDIFYWNFDRSTDQTLAQLNNVHVTILGVNTISHRLLSSLANSGWQNLDIVDHPFFRNLRFFNSDGLVSLSKFPCPKGMTIHTYQEWMDTTEPESLGCLIVTSDFGGLSSFREWNQFAVTNNIPFLPIFLRDEIGYVGPLVIPGDTACFECFLAREKSHKSHHFDSTAIDDQAFSGQNVVGFHPSMGSILGDIATMELTKFFGGKIPGWNVGTLLEVNLLSSRMVPRKILKVPRCPACSSLTTQPSTNLQNDFFNSASRGE
jgi:thiazole/oxazole-forming peptide maturase SagC family component